MKDNHWKMKPNKGKAMMIARKQLSELVWDAVNLEGINFTLPEIQTLLEGIIIGGHRVVDQQIALNQAEAWRTLFNGSKAMRLSFRLLLNAGFPPINLPENADWSLIALCWHFMNQENSSQ